MTYRKCRKCSEDFQRPLEGPGYGRTCCERCVSVRRGKYRVGDKFYECETLTRDEVFASQEEAKQPWYYARSAIQSRARTKYLGSVKSKVCVVCSYAKHIEVAHIKGAMTFPGDTLISTINSLDNLIALCPNHHHELDHGLMDAVDLLKIKGSGQDV